MPRWHAGRFLRDVPRRSRMEVERRGGAANDLCVALWEQARDQVESLCDCAFVLDDGSRVLGHKGVAAARSSYFAGCFASGFVESRSGEARVRDCSNLTFLTFLEFLYTGWIASGAPEGLDCKELFHLGDLTGMSGLREWLEMSIDASSVAPAAEFAMEIEDRKLLDHCYGIATKCLHEIPAHSLEGVRVSVARGLMASCASSRDCFIFLQGYVDANEGCTAEDTRQLLRGVDIDTLDLGFVRDTVVPSGILAEDEARDILEQCEDRWGRLRGGFSIHDSIVLPMPEFDLNDDDPDLIRDGFETIGTDGSVAWGRFGMGGIYCLRRTAGKYTVVTRGLSPAKESSFEMRPEWLGDGYHGDDEERNSRARNWDRGWRVLICSSDRESFLPNNALRPRALAVCPSTQDIILLSVPPPASSSVGLRAHVSVLSLSGNGDGQGRVRPYQVARIWSVQGSEDTICVLSMAVTRDEKVLVCDRVSCSVQAYSKGGDALFKFGSEGQGPGQLQKPSWIAASCNGRIYVVDETRECVEVFDEHGGYLTRFGGRGDLRLCKPKCIAVGPKGEIVVCDSGMEVLQVFDGDGNGIQRTSHFSTWSDKVIREARGLAVGEDSSIWVSSELKPGCYHPSGKEDSSHETRRIKFSFVLCQGEGQTRA